MEAPSVGEIPTANGWQYEPKWDRSLSVFRDRNNICFAIKEWSASRALFSQCRQQRGELPQQRFVLEGELVIPGWRRTFVRPIAIASAPFRESRSETSRSASSDLHPFRSAG
jgi:hypothetical protein